jgi:phosphoribosylformylglycinamidine synthase I
MHMKFGVLVFPGSNCDHDTAHVLSEIAGQLTVMLWHDSSSIQNVDAVLVPGGFAYGDYLRTGAIARFSPVMQAVKEFAAGGGPVLGICNGFQILCESGLLPGALLRNAELKYVCRQVHLRVETRESMFTSGFDKGQILKVPVGHMEGNYFCDAETLHTLESENRVAFRYCDPAGAVSASANPNGSLGNIAGILNDRRNVLGMMPHPDRSSEVLLGSADGYGIFQSLIQALEVTSTATR